MKEISVYVVASSDYFSFNLDENTPLGILADEISSMLGQKERDGEASQELIFYSKERQQILDSSKTLNQLNIHTGTVLSII